MARSGRIRNVCAGAALGAIIMLAAGDSASLAQGKASPGRGGGPDLLLRREVQEELKLSDAQKTQIPALAQKRRAEGQTALKELPTTEPGKRLAALQRVLAEDRKEIGALLNPAQLKRFQQIELQLQGPSAIATLAVADQLHFTDGQKKQVQDVLRQQRQAIADLFRAEPRLTGARPRLELIRKDTEGKLFGILTGEQQLRWREMLGSPFNLAPDPQQ